MCFDTGGDPTVFFFDRTEMAGVGTGQATMAERGEEEGNFTHRLTSGANFWPRLLISWILVTELTMGIDVR